MAVIAEEPAHVAVVVLFIDARAYAGMRLCWLYIEAFAVFIAGMYVLEISGVNQRLSMRSMAEGQLIRRLRATRV